MNPHATCLTCLHNVSARCTNAASRYHGHALKVWNTCSAHQAPLPSRAELIWRLTTCAAGLDWRAEKAPGDCRAYYGDRAAQCRKWLEDLREGPADVEYIAGGLREFERLAL